MNQLALTFPGGEEVFEDLQQAGQPRRFLFAGKQPAEIINMVLPFFFVIAGLVLFVMIVFGGFTIFTSAGNPEKIKQGQGMVVNALIGFGIMFAAYWIIQLLETTLGFKVTP
jgi:hypothetical protein